MGSSAPLDPDPINWYEEAPMPVSRTEKGSSSRKVEGKKPPDQDDLLCKIKDYLWASKTPAADWQTIKDCVEQGLGFPDFPRRPPESSESGDPQGFKDEPMPQLKSDSRAAKPVKSAE